MASANQAYDWRAELEKMNDPMMREYLNWDHRLLIVMACAMEELIRSVDALSDLDGNVNVRVRSS
jgi:hypothetical protein